MATAELSIPLRLAPLLASCFSMGAFVICTMAAENTQMALLSLVLFFYAALAFVVALSEEVRLATDTAEALAAAAAKREGTGQEIV